VQAVQRHAGRRGSLFGEIGEMRQVARLLQNDAQVGRQVRIDRLQVDHLIALDHAEPQAARGLETNNLHGTIPPRFRGFLARPAGNVIRRGQCAFSRSARTWTENQSRSSVQLSTLLQPERAASSPKLSTVYL